MTVAHLTINTNDTETETTMHTSKVINTALRHAYHPNVVIYWDTKNDRPAYRLSGARTAECGALEFRGWANVTGKAVAADDCAGYTLREYFKAEADGIYLGPDMGGIYPVLALVGEVGTQTPRAAVPAQHTPGPWAIDTDTHNGNFTVNTDYQPVVVARIARQDPQNDGGRSFEMERANARLIAAAPELLAALRAFVAEHESDIEWKITKANRVGGKLTKAVQARVDALAAARAAIAKAEGAQ